MTINQAVTDLIGGHSFIAGFGAGTSEVLPLYIAELKKINADFQILDKADFEILGINGYLDIIDDTICRRKKGMLKKCLWMIFIL